jgi:integrase
MVATWNQREGLNMARSKKTDSPHLGESHDLTAGLIERLKCPPDKQQVFLRDTKAPGLRVRATAISTKNPQGLKAFVYEAKLNRQTIRRTIGDVRVWDIEAARMEARRLAVVVRSDKDDPRDLERQRQTANAAAITAATVRAITVGDIWPRYLAEGKPKRKDAFKPRYRADLEAMAGAGGEKKKRGQGVTRPGPIFPLLALPLSQVNEDTLKIWFDREVLAGRHQAARALMMFRGFLRWCSSKPEYRAMTNRDAGRAAAILDQLPSTSENKRTDSVAVAQVPGWWAGVEKLDNRTASVYLKALMLTGARREEVAALKWTDVDFRWRKLTLADKVDKCRVIPLTPYLAQQLATRPRVVGEDGVVNPYVFASRTKGGHISDARASLAKVMLEAGIEKLTIHGLRRTFTRLGRNAVPAGAVAQIAGHKPSATAEGYAWMPLDDLRPYAEQIEAHILTKAGVTFDAKAEPGVLRLVQAA